ncbi:MAG: hypothetical protein ABIF77_04985 [bacterium]
MRGTTKTVLSPLLTAMVVLLVAAPSMAENLPIMDYYGFAWEDGGFLPSDPGDMLSFAGVVDNLHPIVGYDLADGEVTLVVSDLVSTGEVPGGPGITQVSYVGGTLSIYFDPAKNADWGTFPPNAVAPATFGEGTLLFQGNFTSFVAIITGNGIGVFDGTLDGVGGELLGQACTNCAYSWGGIFTMHSGAQLPDGFQLQLDGTLEVNAAVPAQESTWGSVKALYSN